MSRITQVTDRLAAYFSSSKPVMVALLVFIIFLTFFPVLEADYLAYDEHVEILAGPLINQSLTLSSLWRIFSSIEKGANQYTPLSVASFWLEFNLFGQNSAVSHFLNLLLHCLTAVAVYSFLLQLLKRPGLAWFAAAFWALHPFQVHSVAWVLERRNLLYGLFLFASFAAYGCFTHQRKPGFLGAATLFMLLSGLAKTLAFFAPVIWLLIDLLAGRRDYAKMLREKTVALLVGAVLMIVMFKAAAGGISQPTGNALDWNLATFAMSFYVYKTLWPVEILPVYEASATVEELLAHGPAYFVLTALLLAIVSRTGGLSLAGSLFYLLHIFPLSGLIRVGKRFYAAGHFMYVALLGLILAAVSIFDRSEAPGRARLFEFIPACLILLGLSVVSNSHCYVWQNTVSLYEYVLAVDPDSEFSRRNLAVFYAGKSDYKNAAGHFAELVRRHPSNRDYLQSYAVSLQHTGDLPNAYRMFEAYATRFSDCADGHRGKADILMEQNKPFEAAESYSLAVASQNASYEIFMGRAAARIACGNYRGASDDLNSFLVKEPGNLKALMLLSEATRRMGQYHQAVEAARKIVSFRPDSWLFRKRLLELMAESLDYANASVEFADFLANPEFGGTESANNLIACLKQLSLYDFWKLVPCRGLFYSWFEWMPFDE